MRAVVHDRYGPPEVLRIEEVERPVPKADEVLIKVHAATVTRSDCGVRGANQQLGIFVWSLSRAFTGFRRPRQRILGTELAGVIEAIGSGVTEFVVGDAVFGVTGPSFGANAEYVCVRQTGPLARKPPGIGFAEAAAVTDGGTLALIGLRAADVREGQRVLVFGASGSIGTASVQLARALGAHVTAVCSTRHVELARSLGADAVIDYRQEDFTRNGQTYDVIVDAVGKHSFRRCRRSLAPGGIYVATDGLGNLPLAFATRLAGGRQLRFPIPPRYTRQDVDFLKELIEAGTYRPVVDRAYPLEDAVEATRYVETGQKTGSVVLTVVAESRN